MWAGLRSRSGQATVEYVALLLLIAALLVALLAVGNLRRPGIALGEEVAERIVCAVRLSSGCDVPGSELRLAYGEEVATLLAEHVPEIRFEDGDFVSLPVDPRHCRARSCADTSESGELSRSFEDYPATAFVHVVDCREPGTGHAEPGAAGTAGAECGGERAGNLYLQYWLYYPESATRPYGRLGFHRDDWESFQVRIGSGGAEVRASSHRGYNHGPDPIADLRGGSGGWGVPNGYLWVSAGSHAGRAAAANAHSRSIPAGRLRLLPLESELESLSALEFEVTPPWLKEVWLDPEATGT